jgi:hypothetical protein
LSEVASGLPAGPGQPPIIAREAWALGRCLPRVAPEYGAVRMAFVHHTENPNGYRPVDVPGMLRSIFLFHRDIRGWNDIGYNFIVDRFGRIFEGRAGGIDEAIVGAQAGGYNYCSTGIAVLGEYGALDISSAARAALAHLLAWKLSLHGVPIAGRVTVRVNPAGAVYSRFPAGAHVSLPRVAGHRDADSTSCPGNALYSELPGVRGEAGRLAGRLALVSIQVRRETANGVAVLALAGSLAFVDGENGGRSGAPTAGAPIADAQIEIQSRTTARHGEVVRVRTLTVVQTGADGGFAVPLDVTPNKHGSWLRAVSPGASGVPAAVSEPIHLIGAATPSPPSSAPTPPAASPAPVSAPSAGPS